MKQIKKVLGAAVFASILPLATVAMAVDKDAAVTKDGSPVYSALDGCVRTKWDGAQSDCKGNFIGSRKYIIFFDFDSSKVNGNADKILNALKNKVKGKDAQIKVTGHADLSGSAAYNKSLSQRRANAAKQALVNLGISASNITTAAKGESEPMVKTKDGIAEPQNRRVEIVYKY